MMQKNAVRTLALLAILSATVAALVAGGGGGEPATSAPASGQPAAVPTTRPASDSGGAVALPPTATPGGEGKVDFLKDAFPKPPGGIHENPTMAATSAPSEDALIGDLAHGGELFTSEGCAGCHSTGTDVKVGPGLGGMKDRRKQRVAEIPLVPRGGAKAEKGGSDQAVGGMVSVERYVEDSIRNPGRYVIPGFENLMGDRFAQLNDQEIADLVAYVESLP